MRVVSDYCKPHNFQMLFLFLLLFFVLPFTSHVKPVSSLYFLNLSLPFRSLFLVFKPYYSSVLQRQNMCRYCNTCRVCFLASTALDKTLVHVKRPTAKIFKRGKLSSSMYQCFLLLSTATQVSMITHSFLWFKSLHTFLQQEGLNGRVWKMTKSHFGTL